MKRGKYHAGMLRETGDLQRRVLTEVGGGSKTQTWVNLVAGIPFAVIPLSGREQMAGMQLEHPISCRIVIRYNVDVATERGDLMLVERDARREVVRQFNIRGVYDVDDRKRWMELTAEEGVGI